MQVDQLNKKVKLINGSFTPSEVGDLVLKSIDHQINNYKLKNLSNWIHDHNCDQEFYADKIEQLQKRKRELQGIIEKAETAGCNLSLSEDLEIKLDQKEFGFTMS